jgi:hypothetical protein
MSLSKQDLKFLLRSRSLAFMRAARFGATRFDHAALQWVKRIVGELHGERDFELLACLSQWFDISMKKSMRKPRFIFNACNKNALAQILA